MTDQKRYFAVIGDLVASRALASDERSEVQLKFQSGLDKVNKDFAEDIKALFLITAGDEVQGLLYNTENLYGLLLTIRTALFPVKIVFGVGYGEITTDIREYAVGADGPAFHKARRALEQAKQERKAYGKSLSREVLFKCIDGQLDDVVNSYFLALSVFREQWTEKQAQILMMLEKGTSQKDVAEKLSTPLSNVSRTISRTYFNEYTIIAESLQKYIKGIPESLVD